MSVPSDAELGRFVRFEARLIDEKRFDEWYALFTDDAYYWVPAVHQQKSPRAYSQQPGSRSHHLLQTPTVETCDPEGNRYVVRTEFHYTESQGDELQFYVGTFFHHLTLQDGALRMTLKRVNLLNCDAALPAVQLFI